MIILTIMCNLHAFEITNDGKNIDSELLSWEDSIMIMQIWNIKYCNKSRMIICHYVKIAC